MKFGLLINTDYHADVHGPPDVYYGHVLDQIVLAEELGYHSAWFGEHHQGGTKGMYDGITSTMLDEQKLLLISDPAGLVERIEWAREYYGLDDLLLEIGQVGLAHERVVESLTRFSREVMPAFR